MRGCLVTHKWSILLTISGSMLLEAFNPEQADRYDVWRRVKLKKETVRKVCNAKPTLKLLRRLICCGRLPTKPCHSPSRHQS